MRFSQKVVLLPLFYLIIATISIFTNMAEHERLQQRLEMQGDNESKSEYSQAYRPRSNLFWTFVLVISFLYGTVLGWYVRPNYTQQQTLSQVTS
jgi:hypothetical protein